MTPLPPPPPPPPPPPLPLPLLPLPFPPYPPTDQTLYLVKATLTGSVTALQPMSESEEREFAAAQNDDFGRLHHPHVSRLDIAHHLLRTGEICFRSQITLEHRRLTDAEAMLASDSRKTQPAKPNCFCHEKQPAHF